MHILSLGQQTYKLEFYKGSRHITTIVRPLPLSDARGRANWSTELLTLHKELKDTTEALGVPYDYDIYFTHPRATPKGKVIYLLTKYYPFVTSLPISAHEDREKKQMAGRWSAQHFLQDTKHIPMSQWPSRLLHVGTMPVSRIAEIKYVYNRLAGSGLLDTQQPLNVYQCTCGRNIIVPANEGRPSRDWGSCGCLAGIYGLTGTRDMHLRKLDTFREWVTMVMACYDERSVHYNPSNVFDILSYPQFSVWYLNKVVHNPLTRRFVARIDKTKPFTLKNLKIVDKCIDTIPQYGYTIL